MADRRAEDLSPPTQAMKPVTGQRPAATKGAKRQPMKGGSASGSPRPDPAMRPEQSGAAQAPKQPSAQSRAGGAQVVGATAKPATAAKRVRKARLRLTHVDPWSVMKTAFLLSVALGIVTVVAVAVVWSVLGAAGVWDSVNATVGDVLGDSGEEFEIEDYVGMGRVMGFTMIVAVADVFLITVIATLGAFLYNLAAALLGGLEVVLAEDDR